MQHQEEAPPPRDIQWLLAGMAERMSHDMGIKEHELRDTSLWRAVYRLATGNIEDMRRGQLAGVAWEMCKVMEIPMHSLHTKVAWRAVVESVRACAVTQIGVDVERKPRAEPEDVRDDENWQQRPRKMRRGRRGSGKKASAKPKDDDNGMIEIEVDDEPTSPADEALAAKEWEAPKENTGWWSTSSQDWSSDRCGTSSQDWRSGWWGTAHDNDQDWSSGWWGTTSRWR